VKKLIEYCQWLQWLQEENTDPDIWKSECGSEFTLNPLNSEVRHCPCCDRPISFLELVRTFNEGSWYKEVDYNTPHSMKKGKGMKNEVKVVDENPTRYVSPNNLEIGEVARHSTTGEYLMRVYNSNETLPLVISLNDPSRTWRGVNKLMNLLE
jgi:hypothetical protein